jgi:predicted esterase
MNRFDTRALLPVLPVALALGFLTTRPLRTDAQELGSVPRVAPSASAPRGETLEWASPAGRPYWYRVPKKIDAKRPPRLILMLHGTGLDHGWSFWNHPIGSGGFRPDDIVVSPDGLGPGEGDTFDFLQTKSDDDQIVSLIRLFRKRFPIARVYLYGHGQGASFCYGFVGGHPELVDGIVAHAGKALDVSHPGLAKERVAIGILHAKADAVVSVECAYRIEKIYQEQGYRKLKLCVVEGLTERSGHGPLPKQVLEMFEWLDQVTAGTLDAALAVALSELSKVVPDLDVVADAARNGRALLAKYRGEDREALRTKLEAVEAFLEDIAAGHAECVEVSMRAVNRSESTESWRAYFRLVERSVRDTKAWSKTLREQIKLASTHEKAVVRALAALARRPGKGAFVAAVTALERSLLAESYPELRDLVGRVAEKPPRGVGEKHVAASREVIETSLERERLAWSAVLGVIAPRLESFRSKHPDWIPEVDRTRSPPR